MSYTKSFRHILNDKDKSLDARLESLERKAKKLLIYTTGKFPYYTPHNFSHSENVLENLNWIIDDNVKEKLNKYEIFFLIVAAWYHDWGLIGEPCEDPIKIREEHHIRTEQFFEKLYKEIDLEMQEAIIIGKICKGHRKEDLNGDNYKDVMFGSGFNINIRFLASCLRIADECDITANRTPEIIFYSLRPEGDSEKEFTKHLRIGGIGRPVSALHKIRISGISWDPIGVLVLEKVQEKIQAELNGVKLILASNGVIIDTIELEVDTRGFINQPLEISLDTKKIVDILIGSHLYSRPDVGLRELLQNSIDSCRLKKILQPQYNPKIVVTYSKNKIVITDNGLGMNYEDAVNYLSHKGVSFYESDEFKKMIVDKNFGPISRFGIGILSCFMITSVVEIETKKQGNRACKFIIRDLSERWRYEEGSKREDGTSFCLNLNDEGKKIDVPTTIKHYIKSVEIPITIIDEEKDMEIPLIQDWGEKMSEVNDILLYINEENILDINNIIENKKIIYKDDLNAIYITFKKIDNIQIKNANCFLSYKGIYVGNFEFFSQLTNNWIMFINYNDNHFDLQVSRENIVFNENGKKFLDKLYSNFITFIKELVYENSPKAGPLDKYNIFGQLLDKYLKCYIINLDDLRINLFLKIFKENQHPILTNDGLKFMNVSELKEANIKNLKEIILSPFYPHEHVTFICPVILTILNKEQGIIFSPRMFKNIQIGEIQKRESLLSWLCKSNNLSFSEIDYYEIIKYLNLKVVKTPLDEILPNFLSFANLPIELKSTVICADNFKYEAEEEIGISGWTASILILSELFGFDEKVMNMLVSRKRAVDIKKLSQGKMYLDANDEMTLLILKNIEKIESDASLTQLIRLYYFSYIIADQFSFFQELPHEFLSIVMALEIFLSNLFGNTVTIAPVTERRGKLFGVLSDFWVLKPVSIKSKMVD